MLMNKFKTTYILLFVILLSAYFSISTTQIFGQIKEKNHLSPDISINKKVFLHNPISVENVFGNIYLSMNQDNDFPYVYMINSTKEQYLKMVFFPGDVKNSISQFEVGYVSNIKNDILNHIALMDTFFTESGIFLGLSEEDVLRIKGVRYEKIQSNDTLVMKYIIDNYDTSDFLKKYNMPVYFAEYWIVKDKVIRFKFGFEYP